MQTLQQVNLRISKEISVNGFDDIPLAESFYRASPLIVNPHGKWDI
jgi:DNA-binding LacI/PurR family transcriptional regulator